MSHTTASPRPRIIDTTLREGCQAPGARFGDRESVEVAKALRSLSVDMIECGHPHVGGHEIQRVRAVVAASNGIPVLSHARARVEDIDAVKASGARWVGIFVGINPLSSTCRIQATRPIQELIREAIAHAKSLGLMVRFTVEDGSRTEWDKLTDAYRIAREAGADRLCFADTVGILAPWGAQEMVGRLREAFPGADIEVHFHDDRGMADANALAAAKVGAGWISSSVNGVGERCGITDTLLLLANLGAEGWRSAPDGAAIQRACALVEAHSRVRTDWRRPVVGRNAFTHTAKLHRRAVMSDERAYSWMKPELLGRSTSTEPAMLPPAPEALVNSPQVISATELRHHRHGPGDRFVMLDDRVVPDARQYCIVRQIPLLQDYGAGHVDSHRHRVDSMFLFLGNEPGLTGLKVEVSLGEKTFTVDSPSSVFIPSGVVHSYRVLGGAGLFVNHVLSGDYNSSLLDDSDEHAAEALDLLHGFMDDRRPGTAITASTSVVDVFDSLLLLDFFLHLESRLGDAISLDDVASCRTFAEVAALLAAGYSKGNRACVASQG